MYYYAANRHKMTTMTPGLYLESYTPDDNRYDLRPFLYPRFTFEYRKIEDMIDKVCKSPGPPFCAAAPWSYADWSSHTDGEGRGWENYEELSKLGLFAMDSFMTKRENEFKIDTVDHLPRRRRDMLRRWKGGKQLPSTNYLAMCFEVMTAFLYDSSNEATGVACVIRTPPSAVRYPKIRARMQQYARNTVHVIKLP
jgi:hypothetical protein